MSLRVSLVIIILLATSGAVLASDLGTTGLIDTPTARMRDDGEFATVISRQSLVDIYSLNYQATPWLETTFRYSAFEDGLYDRSYEVKLRLLEEGDVVPELAVGVRDLLGTGIFGAEYLVANKAFGLLDISVGMGWGRFADRSAFSNPVAKLSDRFATREGEVGRGGTVQLDNFFAGPDVGIFGGFAYDLDQHNLRFIAEYNSDAYSRAQSKGTASDPSPISYGIEWEPIEGVTLAASHQFGEQFAFRIESRLNSLDLYAPIAPRPYVTGLEFFEADVESENYDFSTWYDRLRYDMSVSGLRLLEASRTTDNTEVTLVLSNSAYLLSADAVNQALVLADRNLPSSFTNLNLVLSESGIRPVTLNFSRGNLGSGWVAENTGRTMNILPGRNLEDPDEQSDFSIGRLGFTINLGTRFQLFDPDDPFRHQIFVRVNGVTNLGQGWRLRGSYIIDLDNNFDEIARVSDSVLPHVRSDAGLYLAQGATGMQSLYFDRRASLGTLHYRTYAGILEQMYSGVGAEVVYQPFRSRVAYGFSANWVKQRDYDASFDHLDYDTVTGFASLYWATPWYNYDVAMHAGRFLAKDLGAKFEVRRTMHNGWVVGAWATLTDVSSEDFGEGSFDKGIFFRIPLQGFLNTNTRSTYTNAIRSIQRDGGQMLENFSGRLWHDLRSTRYDALDENRGRIGVE